MEKADKWDRRFMELTETVAGWSSCFQENRQIGAVIVRDKRILTTGYNGAPGNAKRHHSGGEVRNQRQRRDALLHPSALRHLREDDHKRRNFPRRIQKRLSRRLFPKTLRGSECQSGKILLRRSCRRRNKIRK